MNKFSTRAIGLFLMAFLFFLVIDIALCLWLGYVLSVAYGWMFVPAGFMPIPYSVWVTLFAMLRVIEFSFLRKPTKYTPADFAMGIVRSITVPSAALFILWIIKTFIL